MGSLQCLSKSKKCPRGRLWGDNFRDREKGLRFPHWAQGQLFPAFLRMALLWASTSVPTMTPRREGKPVSVKDQDPRNCPHSHSSWNPSASSPEPSSAGLCWALLQLLLVNPNLSTQGRWNWAMAHMRDCPAAQGRPEPAHQPLVLPQLRKQFPCCLASTPERGRGFNNPRRHCQAPASPTRETFYILPGMVIHLSACLSLQEKWTLPVCSLL